MDLEDYEDSTDDILPSQVKDLKTFTKFCKLSTPTIKKWLEGGIVYKSSLKKIVKSLRLCNLSKSNLCDMRRKSKNKPLFNFEKKFSFEDTQFEFPSISGIIHKVLHHSTNDERNLVYVVETHHRDIVTIHSNENLCYNDLAKIKQYLESKYFNE